MFKLECEECQTQSFNVDYNANYRVKLYCSECGKESDVKFELASLTCKGGYND